MYLGELGNAISVLGIRVFEMYKHCFKRILDIIISSLGLIVLCLPMLFIAIIIKCDSKGPVIFKQKRLGKNKKEFVIKKFRTMCDGAYEKGGIATSESDTRITKIGKVLRRTSLDEIPQLINILIGQMSIIGPRPVLDWEYNEFASGEFDKRFLVRPGLFCTIDLTERNADRDTQFKADVEYSDNCSLWLDIATFFGVIRPVITGKGVYRDEK